MQCCVTSYHGVDEIHSEANQQVLLYECVYDAALGQDC